MSKVLGGDAASEQRFLLAALQVENGELLLFERVGGNREEHPAAARQHRRAPMSVLRCSGLGQCRRLAAVVRNSHESDAAVFTRNHDRTVAAPGSPPGLPKFRESVTTGSPVTATFFKSPPSKNPIHRLSGEKNGVRPLVTPDRGTASSWSRARTISRLRL